MGLVVGIIVAVVFVVALVGLYVWTRRSERDIEIPERELTAEEKQQQLVARGVSGSFFGGSMGNGGGV